MQIGKTTRLLLVEGNYLLLPEAPWSGLPALLDEAWFLAAPVDAAMERIVARHVAANGDSRERAAARVAGNDRKNAEQVWAARGGAALLVPSFEEPQMTKNEK